MPTQKRAILLLERHLPMVFFLVLDIPSHVLDLRLAHGEGAVSVLPGELRE